MLRLLGRREVPLLDVRLCLLDRRAFLVDHQRRVETDRPEPLADLRDALAELRVDERRAMPAQDRVRLFLGRVVQDELAAGLRDAFAQDGLRRRHELDALLDLPLLADQQLLLDRVLGVVAGEDLVPGEMHEVEPGGRHVDVEDDAAAQVTEVVVEGPPGLVGDRLEDHILAGREAEQDLFRAAAHQRQELLEHGDRDVARDEVQVAPGVAALAQRPVAGVQLVELRMHLRVDVLRDLRGPHAVRAFDLVAVGQLVAREHVGVRGAALHLVAQPAVGQLVAQRVGVGRELLGGNLLFRVDLLLQLGRAVVRVDEPVDVLAEPQPEHQIPLSCPA